MTKPMIDRYQRSLFYHRRTNGHPLSFRTQYLMLSSLKHYFRWLVRENHILIITQPDIATPFGVRDRAMLEVLYSTGMRRSELAHLSIYDVDPERGTVFIRQGKTRRIAWSRSAIER